MREAKHKYQTEYEETKGCFWETKPAKYVIEFTKITTYDIQNLNVLDLGAGEGKNSVYIASLGANVTSVDLSKIALSRFTAQPNFKENENKIKRINADIRSLSFNDATFDCIIAYGVLHCLDSKAEINDMIFKIKKWLKMDGYFICATFTDKIPVPKEQNYLNEGSFLSEFELEALFSDFKIIKSENAVIFETHPTSKTEHSHSLVRLIAKK